MRPSAPKEARLVAIMQELAPDFDRGQIEKFATTLAAIAAIRRGEEGFLRARKGKLGALSELRKMNERTIALLSKIDDLGAESAPLIDKALRDQGKDIRQAMESLAALANAACVAHGVISQRAHTEKPANRPEETAARAVAMEAGRCFKALTGAELCRTVLSNKSGGRFQTFLGQVFATLGIDASPESKAKEAAAAAAAMEKRVARAD